MSFSRTSRRALVASVTAAACTLTLVSAAYACTYNKGTSQITDNHDSNQTNATGDNSTMWWCNKNVGGYANGTPTDANGKSDSTAAWADAHDSSTSTDTLTWTQSNSTQTGCIAGVSTDTTYMITYVNGDPRPSTAGHNCHNNKFNTASRPFKGTVSNWSTGANGTWVGTITMTAGVGGYTITHDDLYTAATSDPPADTTDGARLAAGLVSVCLQDSSNSKGSGNFDANLSMFNEL